MKTCRACATTFPEGLTCPGCGAFVPDLFDLEDDPGTSSTDSVASLVHDAVNDPPTAAVPDPPAAPSWASAPVAAAPPPTPPLAPPTPPPPARPSWTTAPVAPAPPAAAAAPAAPSWTSATPTPPAVPGASAGGRPTGLVLALVAAAVIVVLAIGAVALRRSPSPGPIASDIVGTCLTYDAAKERVGAAVPCDGAHDAKVVASVATKASCPAGTTDVLTATDDPNGTAGVLCVTRS